MKTTKTSKTTKRGDKVTTPGGATGWYVGTRRGLVWIAYQLHDFNEMCRAFDGR
jgi:hypothetical protein